MNKQGNKIIIYEFAIIATSPVYFGGDKKGELVKDAEGKPILFGNAIGGALRAHLERSGIASRNIYNYMGGNKENKLIESRIYISDGQIKEYKSIYHKEGTAIDPRYGSAEKHHKYRLEYLSKGSMITFRIEGEVEDDAREREFNKIIGTWEQGFRRDRIKLGGQQNNGFGDFSLIELKKKEFVFNTSTDLDEYIFKRNDKKEQSSNFVEVKDLPYYEMADKKQVSFSLKGKFPYGLYQSFEDVENSKLTGLQKLGERYYLPATSFKGVVRSEVRILLSKFLSGEKIDKKLDEIFGSKECKGKILFSDVVLVDGGRVKVKRFGKDKNASDNPVYIKIDRITGGALEGALKTQREIFGTAILQCRLNLQQEKDDPLLFPLIYVLRRIGGGLVALGGRTAVGLGIFEGEEIKLTGVIEEDIPTNNALSQEQIRRMRAYYHSFEGWCRQ